MDKVLIENLVVMTTIGVYEWEQKIKQKLTLDIEMNLNHISAGKSDELSDAVDYSEVSQAVTRHIESGCFLLIERVAEEVAELIMSQFSVPGVRIRLFKPGAVANAANVGVDIKRGTLL